MRAALALMIAAAAGCAGELDAAEFAQCGPGYVEDLFATRCGDGCHDADGYRGDLDLVSPGMASRLVGAVSASTRCAGKTLVDADSGDGLLLDKVSGHPSCGAAMPFGRQRLSKFEVECVRQWAVTQAGGS